MELRGLAAAESDTPVFASKVADAVARRAGKRRLVKRSAVGAGSALAVGSLAVGAVMQAAHFDFAPFSGVEATGTATPSPETYLAVAYEWEAVEQAFRDADLMPGCGEPAAFEPRTEHGLTVTLELAPPGISADYHTFKVGFHNASDDELTFIANTPAIVLVQGGRVASDPNFFQGPTKSINTDPERPTGGNSNVLFENGFTCAGIKAWDDHWKLWPGEGASVEDRNHWETVANQISNGPLSPGEYTAYAWSPVVFGDQAGIARVWREDGYYYPYDIANPAYPSSPLYGDESMLQYCYSEVEDPSTGETTRWDGVLPDDPNGFSWAIEGVEGEVVHFGCEVPPEILADKLRRLVPESYINDYEMTYIISEPITFTVE
ncbi:MAG: hypothetical protein CVT64_00595 [Actinobacteria bacterium HGW-Actinobacteria-4]|nr:MAG: hypothetical protein CVT64_00595 [Actinobacteria bacterium HGW-Actinobacteria-4]